ncbi:hypothetical protein ONZ45_g9753 [Pleurotus djamor]|nr:hypothetical protein ONZ45_g9753 [Pleurotus djamor]
MSYKITVRVYQTNPAAWFDIVEKTVWNYANGGTWTEVDGKHVLTMGGSGTSGILRFAGKDERFTVALGVHNYKRWVDVNVGLATDQTACLIHKDYYTDGTPRNAAIWKQLSEFKATDSATGRSVAVKYDVAEGNNLECYIIIG